MAPELLKSAPDTAQLTLNDFVALPDPNTLRQEIWAELEEADDAAGRKDILVERLSAQNSLVRERIKAALLANPTRADLAISAYTQLTDMLVIIAADMVQTWLHPKPNPTASERICLLAVGGYGRGEMAPFSDVDLLFLTPWKQTAWGESVIESTLYILWDLKLKVGQAVRTVDECLRLGKTDITIRTALLEHRYLSGEKALAEELDTRLWSELFDKTGPEFVEAKLEERELRHSRHGGARYMLEPNVKEGKGGLRDLQTLFWISKYLHHATSPRDLLSRGVFTQDEFDIFEAANAFLWIARCHLHLVVGRPSEQLTFDAQVEVAANLGFEDQNGQRGVERFMQTYFQHARAVGELTRIFMTSLEAEHVKRRPSLKHQILNAFSFGEPKVSEGYVVNNGRLDYADAQCIHEDPLNILRLFNEALKTGYLIHPDAMRLIAANLDLIGPKMRKNQEANRLFLELLLGHNNPERALRRMNELGVLGAFIPEFGRIVAMMQFNVYHHYTVDEHTIRCISNLNQIENGELVEELPIASRILKAGVNRRVIYIALLLHDIGKGQPEDHSELGAKLAKHICPGLGLDAAECETVVWLIRHHLLMSDVAQKRDLSDPRTVSDFAAIVQSPSRLKLLTVLTVCDIRGVGPGVWNNWKAMLIRELYALTLDHLSGGARESRPQLVEEAKAAFIEALDGDEAAADRHYDGFWVGLDLTTQLAFQKLLKKIKSDEPVSQIDQDKERDATRCCFVMPDHPGIFSRLAGALALVGANVVDARTYTTRDGIATAVFWIQDQGGAPYEKSRLTRLRSMIRKTLRGEVVARDAFRDKDRIKKRDRDFVVPTEITFDNEGSEIYTIIEVDTRDRPGLLYDLTRTLAANNISIFSAIIATYGKQVVDTFYVKDLVGLKLHSRSKQRAIEKRLMEAIRQGSERAAE